ncbi:hypothetical protein JCGZ_01869 [Jatropha curcas]|uniref:Uncharacterized protein n=1 Tax=Jatropha curcas TaxID=180498 RepID=A0A067L0T8_JATCU|nr:hypothetical protein JCGZ_01869 [Jatropha curcas]
MENENNNINGAGSSSSSSSLGSFGSLKPFFKTGIASFLTVYIPVGCFWSIISSVKDEKLKKILNQDEQLKKIVNNPENLRARFKHVRAVLPSFTAFNAITFGLFEILTRKAMATNDGIPLSLYQEVSCGLLAEIIGRFVTAPYIVAKNIMRADSCLPVEKRVNYRNIYHALCQNYTKGQILASWRGQANIGFMLSRTAMFASYHRSLGYFEDFYGSDGSKACLAAGAVSGFFQTVISKPTANVDMRMRTMKLNSEGKYPYTSHIDCGLKILKSEGLFALYRGFLQPIPGFTYHIMAMWWWLRAVQEFEEKFINGQVKR